MYNITAALKFVLAHIAANTHDPSTQTEALEHIGRIAGAKDVLTLEAETKTLIEKLLEERLPKLPASVTDAIQGLQEMVNPSVVLPIQTTVAPQSATSAPPLTS